MDKEKSIQIDLGSFWKLINRTFTEPSKTRQQPHHHLMLTHSYPHQSGLAAPKALLDNQNVKLFSGRHSLFSSCAKNSPLHPPTRNIPEIMSFEERYSEIDLYFIFLYLFIYFLANICNWNGDNVLLSAWMSLLESTNMSMRMSLFSGNGRDGNITDTPKT